ncbi:hypothetical protein BH20ACT8_BH20ACT8_09180 [soil metagenome]
MSPPKAPGRLIRVAAALHHVENAFYVMVAVALAFAGAALFADALYQFAVSVGEDPLRAGILDVLDGLLLVFIVSELLHTVRTVIDEEVLRPDPFLIVGIVAVVRRLIVISAEAAEFVGDPRFTDLMIEMGVLVGAALGLGVTIFLLRLGRSEPLATE